MFFSIDSWLVNMHERLASEFQAKTKKDCFFLARFCLLFSLACFFVSMVYLSSSFLKAFIYTLFVMFIGLSTWNDVSRSEKQAKQEIGYMNKNKKDLFFARVFLLYFFAYVSVVLYLFSELEVFLVLCFFMYISSMYFASCDMFPPKQKKQAKIQYFAFKTTTV